MAFIKSIFFAAFVAAVSAQIVPLGELEKPIGQVPVVGEQLGQMMPTTKAPAGEVPVVEESSRLTNKGMNNLSNGLNSLMRKTRRQ